jgi:uncharacterized membrane protein YoaK (UPF0700 family)
VASRSIAAPLAVRGRGLSATALRDILLVVLTFGSGALDAISFLGLGKVFAAFQTGNLVFLGIGAAHAGGPDIVRVVCALAGFGAGVLAATLIADPLARASLWSRRATLILCAGLAVQAGFLVLWASISGHPGPGSGDTLMALGGIAMGLQSGAVLALAVPGVFTTAATATVILLMRDLADRGRTEPAERARLAGVLIGLVAGAAAGSALLVHARAYAPVIPMAVTALVIAAASVALRSPRPGARRD